VDRPDFHFQQFSDRSLRELAFVTEYQRPSTALGQSGDCELDGCEQLRLAFRRSRYRIWLDLGTHRRRPSLLRRRMRPTPRRPLTENVVRPVTDGGIEIEWGDQTDGRFGEQAAEGLKVGFELKTIAAPKHNCEVFDFSRRRPWTTRTRPE
jgi:hypothetical protein